MKLTANEEYGVRCLVRIAYAGYAGQSLTIPEISQAEGVSPAYAAKILRVLRKGGFVKAAQRQRQGVTPWRGRLEAIAMGDVIDVLGEPAYSKAIFATAMRGQGGHLHALGGLLGALALARGPGSRGPGAAQSHSPRPAAKRRRDEHLGPPDPRRQRFARDVAPAVWHSSCLFRLSTPLSFSPLSALRFV